MLAQSILFMHLIYFYPACIDCNEGQRRCIGNDADNQCCNWYLNDECYVACPPGFLGNTDTFNCGK